MNGAEYGDALSRWAAPPGCVITADGAYGARLTRDGESWCPERWTLDGPEPYAVRLPGPQPEEPGTEVLPLTDGRVLIHRVDDGRHTFSLLYPTGPGTGELPLGAVECPDAGTVLRLLPPAPDGERAYALAVGRGSTAVWLVAGGAFGPEHLAEVPGHCSGGVWLDGTGRLLALDRLHDDRTKTVVVDLERGGEVSPLLQIAEHSNDRLLLADADSGLLLIRSDAPSPGRDRLGWGVLGSTLPVRFPDCLSATGCSISPFAIQPGQVLTPESCAVALRIDGPGGTWVGVWRPSERRIHHRPAPEGWLPGTGLWTAEGVLRLPYVTGVVPCGVARLEAPQRAGGPYTGDPALPGLPSPRAVPLQQAPLRTGRPAGPPRPVPGTDPAGALPVHPAPDTGTVRAARDEAVRAVGGPRTSDAGTGPAPEARETLSTVTPMASLTHRTSPAEAWRADANPGRGPGRTLPPVARPAEEAGEKAEPLRPVVRRAPEAAEPARPQPSRWTRVSRMPVSEPRRRAEPAGALTTGPDLWTKVAETPPPGMGLRTRADGTLPGGMTVVVETAEPLPPVTEIGTGIGTGADIGTEAGSDAGTDTGLGTGTEATADAGAETCAGPGSGTGAGTPAGAGVNAGAGAGTDTGTHAATGAATHAATGAGTHAGADTTAGGSAGAGTGAGGGTGASANTAAEGHATLRAEAGAAPGAGIVATVGPGVHASAAAPGTIPSAGAPAPAVPLPPASDHGPRTAAPLPAAADPGHGITAPLPAAAHPGAQPPVPLPPNPWAADVTGTSTTAPGPWTKVADTPPPGMNLGAGAGGTPPGGTVAGNGNTGAVPPVGEFRGQVALRPLATAPQAPAESGRPCVLAHTDEEKRDATGEETSPSDSRAMTAR
ncbi:hypothetical protein ACH4S8_20265 [Streptomyces sp. NPDC021080]|uniref:hypothetical protein n=1 Tax=Streptomyces sp. NPDC021080 TaxID=3365110 RepID=UPI00378FD76B